MRSPLDVLHGPLLASAKFGTRLALILLLVAPAILHAQIISGTVLDPSGAVVAGARIEITGGDLTQPIILSSDGQGKFTSSELKPGSYSVRVVREGFEPLVKTVDLRAAVELQLTLAVAKQQENISVMGKSLAFANSDQLYKQLREVGLGSTYHLDNFTLTWDAGTFHFEKGTLTVLAPINGILSGAIFIGEGHFNLKPVLPPDAHELNRRTGADELNEDFNEVVFRFTRDAWPKLAAGVGEGIPNPPGAAAAFNHWKEKMRQRREVPVGFTQFVLQGETMDNVDADILSASTIRRTRNFSMPTFTARSTKTCASSCAIAWEPFLNSIRPRKLASSTTIPRAWTTASGISRI